MQSARVSFGLVVLVLATSGVLAGQVIVAAMAAV
jgi:hypothetical protein